MRAICALAQLIDLTLRSAATVCGLAGAGGRGRFPANSERYGTVPFRTVQCYPGFMTTIRAEDVRIPRHAREAVARHEQVVVVNRERPAFIIVHPDDTATALPARRGRSLRDALGLLANAAL